MPPLTPLPLLSPDTGHGLAVLCVAVLAGLLTFFIQNRNRP